MTSDFARSCAGAVIPVRRFAVQLCPTRRGARLARLLAVEQLAVWGSWFDPDRVYDAGVLVGELAANAVVHGSSPVQDFRLGMSVDHGSATLRVEVTDPRPERRPLPRRGTAPGGLAESGRGLLLVQALADRWGVSCLEPCRKTVWCELDLC